MSLLTGRQHPNLKPKDYSTCKSGQLLSLIRFELAPTHLICSTPHFCNLQKTVIIPACPEPTLLPEDTRSTIGHAKPADHNRGWAPKTTFQANSMCVLSNNEESSLKISCPGGSDSAQQPCFQVLVHFSPPKSTAITVGPCGVCVFVLLFLLSYVWRLWLFGT